MPNSKHPAVKKKPQFNMTTSVRRIRDEVRNARTRQRRVVHVKKRVHLRASVRALTLLVSSYVTRGTIDTSSACICTDSFRGRACILLLPHPARCLALTTPRASPICGRAEATSNDSGKPKRNHSQARSSQAGRRKSICHFP